MFQVPSLVQVIVLAPTTLYPDLQVTVSTTPGACSGQLPSTEWVMVTLGHAGEIADYYKLSVKLVAKTKQQK